MRRLLFILIGIVPFSSVSAKCVDTTRTLIIFFDGLRPDYIRPELMPNLYSFSLKASQGLSHRSIYPTVTRVNATSYTTGCYPDKHGILGNSIFFPSLNNNKVYNTGDAKDLVEADSLLKDGLVQATSMGQVIHNSGNEMMVFSSGSSGQAYLQDHSRSGRMVNTDLILPESFKSKVLTELGPIPVAQKPNILRHKWITDGLIKYGISEGGPLVNAIWYSDPDGAAHSDGIGSPAAVESLKSVDHEFGRILNNLDKTGLRRRFNIIISTDHGFATYIGKENLTGFLIRRGFKQSMKSNDVIVAGGAIYINEADSNLSNKIVFALQENPSFGAIFTRPVKAGSNKGIIPGTLAFTTIHWNYPGRVPDILVDMNWSDSVNKYGYRGSSFSVGVAGHGSLSPYETSIQLLVDGPGFKKQIKTELPTANIDIAPTVLKLHGLPIPIEMDGRIIDELFLDKHTGKQNTQSKNEVIEVKNVVNGTLYILRLHRKILKDKAYIDFAETLRQKLN
jgi:predicted AlkP superfamily pyrophosphatase or phosphodiesterase